MFVFPAHTIVNNLGMQRNVCLITHCLLLPISRQGACVLVLLGQMTYDYEEKIIDNETDTEKSTQLSVSGQRKLFLEDET